MTIEVLIFGAAAAAAKGDRVVVRLEPPATARGVLEAIGVQHPGLRFAVSSGRLAVNHAFAHADAVITSKDELALISLVGGG